MLDSQWPVDAPIALPTAQGAQLSRAVARGRTTSLVLWYDNRHANGPYLSGTRLGAEGAVLDATGLAISSLSGKDSEVAAVFDGTNYLVVWTYRSNPDAPATDLYAARISEAGVVLQKDIALARQPSRIIEPVAASDGVSSFIVWGLGGELPSPRNVYGLRVSSSGVVLDPAPIAIAATEADESEQAIAFDGTNYWVIWNSFTELDPVTRLLARRVSAQGQILDATALDWSSGSGWQGNPALAFDGTNLFAVWTHYTTDITGSNGISGRLFNRSGSPVGAGDITIATGDSLVAPRVSFDGTNYLVAWQHDSLAPAWSRRVSATGAILDPGPRQLLAGEFRGAKPHDEYDLVEGLLLAFDGTHHLAITSSLVNPDVFALRVGSDGQIAAPGLRPISTGVSAQGRPAIAYGSDGYLAVWSDYRNWRTGRRDVYGALLPVGGQPPSAPTFSVSNASSDPADVAVASDGTSYLVVWSEERDSTESDVLGMRVSKTGVPLDSEPIAICVHAANQTRPKVEFTNGSYLVVWEDQREYATHREDIYGAQVSQAGAVLQANIRLAVTADPEWAPALTVARSGFVAAWMSAVEPQFPARIERADVRVSYIVPTSQSGLSATAPVTITATGDPQGSLAMRSDGENLLVVWADRRSDNSNIYGARLSGNSIQPAEIPIATTAVTEREPSVAFDGARFLVAWSTPTWTRSEPTPHPGIRGRWIERDGTVSNDILQLSPDGLHATSPRLASEGQGRAVLTYDRFNDDPAVRANRVFIRSLFRDCSAEPACSPVDAEADAAADAPAPDGGRPDGGGSSTPSDGDDGGCSCRVSGSAPGSLLALQGLLLGLAVWCTRRKMRRAS